MDILRKGAAIACSLVALTATGVTGDKEDALIDKVVAAYGGDAISDASAIRITSSSKILAVGQSANPAMMDIGLNNFDVVIDYASNRRSATTWTANRGGNFLNQAIHTGETGHNINHIRKTTAENANLQLAVVGGGVIRSTDTALVRLMLEGREEAVHGGTVKYQGRDHQTLTFKMEGSPDLTVFVDDATGLISKMERQNPQLGTLSYLFGNYRKSGGVTYASDLNFYIAGQPNIVSVKRHVEINPDTSGAFDLPSGYAPQGSNIDTSEMITRDLGNGVYFAGQGNGYSIFVDAGDHYVASGGYPALPDRLKAVQELAGNEKPLGKQVVTHHHSDHLGGMNEVVELGAKFVTVGDHVQPIRDVLTSEAGDDSFVLVNEHMKLADGKVELYNISTAHSAQYLLFYVPELKTVFSADHFSTNLAEGLPAANNNMVTFRQAVEALDIDVEHFLGAHGARTLTMDDLRNATEGYQVAACPARFDICAD